MHPQEIEIRKMFNEVRLAIDHGDASHANLLLDRIESAFMVNSMLRNSYYDFLCKLYEKSKKETAR